MWIRNSRLLFCSVLVALCAVMASCSSGKHLAGKDSASGMKKAGRDDMEARKMDFLRKVYDNEVYVNCISSKVKATFVVGEKSFSVAGSLKMKQDDVIRIQLTPFGLMEAGRLEFTKDYVLIVDRINKEYVKAGYDEVEFLKRNGLDFYALQALFRNRLFIPGLQKLTDSSLKNFGVTFNDASESTIVTLGRGNISYEWNVGKDDGRINGVKATYAGGSGSKASVSCVYGAFKPLASKKFPSDITLKMQSDAVKSGKNITLSMSLSNFDTSSDWETRTTLSGKYKPMSSQDMMNLLMKIR